MFNNTPYNIFYKETLKKAFNVIDRKLEIPYTNEKESVVNILNALKKK